MLHKGRRHSGTRKTTVMWHVDNNTWSPNGSAVMISGATQTYSMAVSSGPNTSGQSVFAAEQEFTVFRVVGAIALYNADSATPASVSGGIIVQDLSANAQIAGYDLTLPSNMDKQWMWLFNTVLNARAAASGSDATRVIPVDIRVKRKLRPHQSLNLQMQYVGGVTAVTPYIQLRTLIGRVA